MVKVKASDLPLSTAVPPRCEKLAQPFLGSKGKKKIDLEAIGTPRYNLLLDLLRCQVRAAERKAACVAMEKKYSNCHGGIMGTGSYGGKKHCGEEMEDLLHCAFSG